MNSKNKNTRFFTLLYSSLIVCFALSLSPLTFAMEAQGIRQLTTGTVIPELWSIESKAELISSKIDIPASCAPTAITASGTITGKSPIAITSPAVLTDSGAYCLAQDIDATGTDTGIVISGSNITLDLNGYTIKNGATGILISGDMVSIKKGTIANATAHGIMLQNNSNCRIESVDVVNTPTGFLIQNSDTNYITQCRALENSGAGFSLLASSTNKIVGCQALNQTSENSVYGFIADTGANNSFEACTVSSGKTDALNTAALIGGIVFKHQSSSKILQCSVNDLTATTTYASAYGLLLQSAWATQPDTLSKSSASNTADHPQIAFGPNGHALSVWNEYDFTLPGYNIYARFFNGTEWSTSASKLTNGPNLLTFAPQIAFSLNNTAIAVWYELAFPPVPPYFTSTIYAQSFDGTDWSLTASNINNDPNHPAYYPQIATDNSGNAIAVWQENNTNFFSNIYARRYIAGTGWESSAAMLNNNTNRNAQFPQISFDPIGNAIAIWQESNSATNQVNIYARRYIAGTGWEGSATNLNNAASQPASNPQIAFDQSGNALAVWSERTGYSNQINIYARRYIAGTGWENIGGSASQVNFSLTTAASNPQIAFNPNSNAIAVWQEESSATTPASIYARDYTVSLGWQLIVNISNSSCQSATNPQIAFDQQGSALAVWQEANANQYSICTRRYNSGTGWENSNNPAATINKNANSVASDPQIAFDQNNNAIAVWGEGGSIYARRRSSETFDCVDCTITKNLITNTTSASATGVGIWAYGALNYVAQNTSCNNDINYTGISTNFITSQANARGVYNVDCNVKRLDDVSQILDATRTIENKLDLMDGENWSIESKAEVISSKVDTIPSQISPELWSIESKAEIISSKIDTIPGQLSPELWSIESKAEVISSKVDILGNSTGCESIPLRSPDDVIGGVITISAPGNYCLAMDMTATVSITAPNVCLDLNCRELTGSIIINAENVTVKDGTVTAPAPINNTDAEQAAITITAAGARSLLQNVTVECLSLADTSADIDGIDGRSAINNDADSVQINNCQIQAGNGQGISKTDVQFIDNSTGSGGIGINTSGSQISIKNCSIQAGASGNITGQSTIFSIDIASQADLSIGAGGTGIKNMGTALQVSDCSISAGSSGSVTANTTGNILIARDFNLLVPRHLTINSGGDGIFNTGINSSIANCTLTAGSTGGVSAFNGNLIEVGTETSSLTIHAGGKGIYNAGTNLQVLNSTITAGTTGNITANANNSDIRIGRNGTITTGIGGIGILNAADTIYIATCIATGGASCSIISTDTGASGSAIVGSTNGYVLTAQAGDAILTTTNSNGTITDCTLSTTNGGSVTVVTLNKFGSADGSSGGNGISCDGASNLQITNCIIKKTGNGGNGYRSFSEVNANNPGNGGNGGSGILIKSNCTNTQISNCAITNTGVGGSTGPTAGAINGQGGHGIVSLGQSAQINNNTIAYTGSSIDVSSGGLAISCVDSVAPAVYSNFAHNIAAPTAYYLISGAAVDSTSGTAFTAITYPLQNIHKP